MDSLHALLLGALIAVALVLLTPIISFTIQFVRVFIFFLLIRMYLRSTRMTNSHITQIMNQLRGEDQDGKV